VAAFEFQALDTGGKTVKGVIAGDTPRQVRQQLRDRGLAPLQVVAVREEEARGGPGGARRGRLPPSELAVITRQLATLVGSGLTLEDAFSALIEQSERHQVKKILSGVRSMIMEGHSLAQAVAAFPRAFPDIYRASILAGEQSGRLDIVLERLATYTESRQELQQRLSLALVYPALLVTVSLLIVVFLFTYVVPKVVKVFEDTGKELPLLTRIFIDISDFLQTNGLWLLLGGLAVVLLTGAVLRRPGPRYRLHLALLRGPWLRRFVRGLNTARMSRTLAIMVGSGVPLLTAMTAGAGVISNLVMREAMNRAAEEVEEGVSLNRALARSGHFPPILVQMVASGEASGQLDAMLEKAALAQEREVEARVTALVRVFEPLMIVFMGAIVMVIVLAILLPIFDINQLIG
jgi:general secretion pathway protein F